ncbi:transposase [Pseudomonas syringae]|nr:hypothetical protein BKC06_004105 [Pseudomonas syringae pv. syringae]MCF5398448.1 transposase [Pseudomonas syringae]MCF5399612.1 transposase [Pseudomonas syringae]MCF5432048.1 transposase [Pseudomonas syringae]MCF5438588.1 transposase [Pseudomonas syringae]
MIEISSFLLVTDGSAPPSSSFARRRFHRSGHLDGQFHVNPGHPGSQRRWKKRGPQEPPHHCLGRSRGGLTTKIHLACDSHGFPLAIMLSPGEQVDSCYFKPLLDQISLPGSKGRPRKRCRYVLADKGYCIASLDLACLGCLTGLSTKNATLWSGCSAGSRKNVGFVGVTTSWQVALKRWSHWLASKDACGLTFQTNPRERVNA